MRVLVVGAGIAGLAVASFLARAGVDVTVIEKAFRPNPEGAGIQISPNAARVLEALGVLDAVREASIAPTAIDLFDGPSGSLLSSFELGRAIADRHGAPYLLLERSRLRDVIALGPYADFPVFYDTPLQALDPGLRGEATFGGRSRSFDLIVGADGVGSAVRTAIPNAAVVEQSGRTAWRRTTYEPAEDRTAVRLYPQEHRVRYPVPGGTNEVWIKPDDDGSPGSSWQPWPVLEVNHTGPWTCNAVALIGDAAHAMPPYAAQGGAMALEDAAVLVSYILQETDQSAALTAYETTRRPRIAAVAALTAANRHIYHMVGLPRITRNLAMRAAPQALLQRRMDRIYAWRPPAIRSSPAPKR